MLHPRPAKTRVRKSVSAALTALLVLAFLPGAPPSSRVAAQAAGDDIQLTNIPAVPPGQAYRQTNLISDVPGLAPVQDPLLVNPWGVTETSSSPFWVANNGTGSSTLYRGDVSGSPFVKNPGFAGITIPCGLPTGTVANTTSDFVVSNGAANGPARFIFATLTGRITGWNPNVPAAGSTAAQIAFGPASCSTLGGHAYTGLAIGVSGGNNFLYAADFDSATLAGSINVFDKNYALQSTASFPFTDTGAPAIPADFRPFNITNIGGSLFVSYAKRDPTTHRSVNGPGLGFVSKFNTDGTFIGRLISNGALDAPWGMVIAPASFGLFPGALLVGNFSDNGIINAYNPTSGAFLGTLQNEAGQPIVNDQLWALIFGNGGAGGDPNTLYFSAGIADEEHGLFGKLNPTTATATSLIQFASDTFAIGEGSGHIDITIFRAGDASGTATVNVNTFDASQAGHASQKSDYEIALQKVTFAPGDTSKTVRILIVDDKFVEGDETVNLALSNPTGTGVGLGSPNQATLTITDNDSSPSSTNPVDDAQFFVRQQYLDFLNREPDPAGFNFWVNNITSCGSDAQCIEVKRINTSAAFFLSIEFQRTGLTAYLANKAAFNSIPLYGRFELDTQRLQKDFVFGAPGADAVLEANKQAYFNDFVTRPEFVAKFGGLTNGQYVDSLLASAGIDPPNVRLFVTNLTNSQENPPTTPTTSTGGVRPASFGTARFQFNAAQTAMTFTATVNNIDFTGSQTADTNDNLIAAHIHASPTVTPTTNGPVVWGFFGSPFNDNNPNDVVNTPFSTGVGGTISGKWDAPEGNGTTLAAQLSNIRGGHAYINFHTTQFGGGEIRGNIPAEDTFRNSLVAGLDGSTLTRAQVLRQVAESEEFTLNEFNRAFVTMEYFGYLRRDADTAGFNFWLNKLNAFNGNFINAEMVKAFLSSSEYRQRFGPS
jgi:uncharacterized protein (TIGR03118 family)